MKLTVLGSGTTFPDPQRGPAGLLVQAGDTTLLVDGGSGTLQRLARAGVDPLTLDGGVYSHGHPDHMADLLSLLFLFRVGGRARPYPIYATEPFQPLLDGLYGTFGKWLEFRDQRAQRVPLPTARFTQQIGDIRLRVAPANHSAGALHLSFEHGDSRVVFSGDTARSTELEVLATGADLLVCECAGSDAEPIRGHLTPSEIRQLVERAQPKAVWLTHLYPHVDPETAVATVAKSGVPVRHAADLDVWNYSHSMVPGGLLEMS